MKISGIATISTLCILAISIRADVSNENENVFEYSESNTIKKEQYLRQNQKLESSTFMTDVTQVDDDSFLPSGDDILVALLFFIPGMIYLIITFPIWFPCLSVGTLLSPILIGVPCASIGSGVGGPGFCLLLLAFVIWNDVIPRDVLDMYHNMTSTP